MASLDDEWEEGAENTTGGWGNTVVADNDDWVDSPKTSGFANVGGQSGYADNRSGAGFNSGQRGGGGRGGFSQNENFGESRRSGGYGGGGFNQNNDGNFRRGGGNSRGGFRRNDDEGGNFRGGFRSDNRRGGFGGDDNPRGNTFGGGDNAGGNFRGSGFNRRDDDDNPRGSSFGGRNDGGGNFRGSGFNRRDDGGNDDNPRGSSFGGRNDGGGNFRGSGFNHRDDRGNDDNPRGSTFGGRNDGGGNFRGSGFSRRDDGGNDDNPRGGTWGGGNNAGGNFRGSGFNRQDDGDNDDNPRGTFGGRNDGGGNRGNGFSRGGGDFRGGRGGFGSRNEDEDGGSGFRGGRGGSGFRGGRGGQKGFDNDEEFSGSQGFRNNDRESNKFEFQGGQRDSGMDDGEKPKPREIYIPPEVASTEEELYNSGISSGINFDKYDRIDIKVSGDCPPNSITSFESSGLRQSLVENVKRAGYRKPTPVQKAAIPMIMDGRDLMACAQTGSGKTAAFLLPIIHSLMTSNAIAEVTPDGAALPQCIIMSPTRELVMQTYTEARKFAWNTVIKCERLYGGTSVNHQTQNIMKGVNILVATPGRLHDLVNRGRLSFTNVRYLVLDEADRMLDMGFLSDIEKMMNHPQMKSTGQRVTLMFSATFPTEVQQLAGKFLHNYLFLAVGVVGGACADVEQTLHQVTRFEKRNQLIDLLNKVNTEKTIVFVETKRNADFLAAYLSQNGFPTTSIHGDRLQREREEALRDFRGNNMRIMMATAVAARGLDIKDVGHVINFDLPKTIDEYVHRIGRTGRVGNCGKATSFYDPEQDKDLATDLLKILVQAEQNVPTWLQQEAQGGSLTSFTPSRFGGSDIRKMGGQSKEQFVAPVVADDETWD